MEIDRILELIKGEDPNVLVSEIKANCKPLFDSNLYKDYTPEAHDVTFASKRPNRSIYEPMVSDTGVPLMNKDNKTPMTKRVDLPVVRISVPFEKKAIRTKSAFTCGKINLKAQFDKGSVEEKMFEAVKKVWRKNKLDFKTKDLLKNRMSQCECAELWFGQKDGELRMNILAPTLGHTLRPIWDRILNMVGFGVEYVLKVEGKDVNYLDLYLQDKLYKYSDITGSFVLDEEVEISYGKIPIIYWFQEKPECIDAKPARERYESLISDLGEQNKRTGFPITFATGKVQGVPAGEPGKFLQGEIGSDVKFVTNNTAPAAIELEMKTLKSEMHSAISTPDLSLEALRGLNIESGEALRRLLIDLYLEAKNEHDGSTGECIQRRINFLQYACASFDESLRPAADMEIYAEFEVFTLDAVLDKISIATKANGNNAVTSQKNAFIMAGLSDDPVQDYEDYIKETEVKQPKIIAPPKPI